MPPYAYGKCAVQVRLEKAGWSCRLSAKKGSDQVYNRVKRKAEGSEAAQQFAENAIAQHTYDPNQIAKVS